MTSYATFIKHAEKVTKTATNSRPILKGVYHAENGQVFVTDSYRLYRFNYGYSNGESFTSDIKTGKHIEGNYPDVSRIIPENDAQVTLDIDVAKTLVVTKSLQTAAKALSDSKNYTLVQLEHIDDNYLLTVGKLKNDFISSYKLAPYIGEAVESIAIQSQFLIDALTLFKEAGETSVTLKLYGQYRPITISSSDVTTLIVPVRVA